MELWHFLELNIVYLQFLFLLLQFPWVLLIQEDPTRKYFNIAFIYCWVSIWITGFLGMKVAALQTIEPLMLAEGLAPALNVAFTGGSVMGMSVVGLGVLGLTILFIFILTTLEATPTSIKTVLNVISGFSWRFFHCSFCKSWRWYLYKSQQM